MRVIARLHTVLRRKIPGGAQPSMDVDLAPGSTITDLVQHLGIELEPRLLLFAVNGRIADLDQELNEGDKVNLMVAISGG